MTTERPRVQLLPRFYLLGALALVTLVTGMATGFSLFYRLLYVLAITGGLTYLWNYLTIRSVGIEVERRIRQARVGDTITENITITNTSWLPKFAIEIEDMTDLPGYQGGMAVTLGGYREGIWESHMPARKRGVYTLGPVRVSTTDPFGIFRHERLFGDEDSLIIYPRTYNLPAFQVPAADLTGDSSVRRKTHQVTPHASSIREHVFGDSLSRVHWKSTARLGRLMSKEFDLGRASEVWIMVDLHRDVQAGDLEESTDEYAVSIAASMAKRYLDSELPVGLVTYGDRRYFQESEPGAGQHQRIMQDLAMSKAEGTTALEEALPKEEQLWGHQSTLVAITPSPRIEWVVALSQLMKRGVKVTVVLLDGQSFGGFLRPMEISDELYLSGIPTYVVQQGDDIALALSRRYTGGHHVLREELEEVVAGV